MTDDEKKLAGLTATANAAQLQWTNANTALFQATALAETATGALAKMAAAAVRTAQADFDRADKARDDANAAAHAQQMAMGAVASSRLGKL